MPVILVWRKAAAGREYLVLRAAGAADGDEWAWRPPSGGMDIGESEEACARRELFEETGLSITLMPAVGTSYPTFVAELVGEPDVELSDEHDALEWVDGEELVRRCRPDIVSSGLADALERLGHRSPT